MKTADRSIRVSLLALGIAAAIGLPALARAQTSGASGQTSATEQQLERRVEQLEQELSQLKAEIQAQRQAQASAPAPVAAQTVAAQPVAASPAPPAFTTAPGMSVALHGFISASAFNQSKSFSYGNGQNAEYPVPGSTGSLSGVDIRSTRFWLDWTGARFAGEWTGGGRIEMDFFGGFNGTGPYSQQQPVPRLRQAYMDLANPAAGTTVRIGQQWDLMYPLDNLPASLAHLSFPLGFGTGFVGWRFPGIVWMQELNHGSGGPVWRLDLGAFEGSWNGPNGAVNNTNYLTAGNAGFRPQVEARLRVQGSDWLAYLAAHYSRVDLRGVGNTAPAPLASEITSWGYQLGGQWKPGPWTFKAAAYAGRGLGELFGGLSQFGDIQDRGGFVQAGYGFTPHWSGNVFYGISKPGARDVRRWMGNGATGLIESRQAAVNLEYAAGAYELGVEWMRDSLDWLAPNNATKSTSGNQLSLSALYRF
ncbi:MAG: hypothetical protein OJF55_000196 [Rhodanobacteraceae bacterium]|jgi:hypothetical protein|nr:MAG: hypothetical protein OJF55_000196 [Rhodanobacteraceae bacterium]